MNKYIAPVSYVDEYVVSRKRALPALLNGMGIVKRSKDFFLRKIDGLYALHSINGPEEKMVFLNETALFLWEKMGVCHSRQDLVKALTDFYNVKEDQAMQDVSAFLDYLAVNGCIESEDSA